MCSTEPSVAAHAAILAAIVAGSFASPGPAAAQDVLELRERAGDAVLSLELERSTALPAAVPATWGLGFDGTLATLADSSLSRGIVIAPDGVTMRELDCAAPDIFWIGTTGAAFVYVTRSAVVLCDPRVGRPVAVGSFGSPPSNIGRGHDHSIPVTLFEFGSPVELFVLDPRTSAVDTIDPRHAAATARTADAPFGIGHFDVTVANDTLVAVVDGRSLRGVLYRRGLGGVRKWQAGREGLAHSPFSQAEIEALVQRLPDNLRSNMSTRLAASGKAYVNRYRIDMDEAGNVWLALVANDPPEHFLGRVEPDGRILETRLPSGVRAISYAANRLALWRSTGEGGSEVAVYRIRVPERHP